MADRKISALSAISGATPAGFQLTDLLAAARPGDSTNYKMDGTELLTFLNDNAGSFVNAFKTLSVAGQSDVVADSGTDTLTIAGVGITVTTNAGTDTITFTVTAADAAGINTGTSTTTFATPDAIAGSYAGTKTACFSAPPSFALVVGDGAGIVKIPASLNGMNLVSVNAEVASAPSGGTVLLQLRRDRGSVDMLSTRISIDDGETGSDTAATPAVINTSNDDVATNDIIYLDVDAANGADGLILIMEFRLP